MSTASSCSKLFQPLHAADPHMKPARGPRGEILSAPRRPRAMVRHAVGGGGSASRAGAEAQEASEMKHEQVAPVALPPASTAVDAVTLEIIRGKLLAIVDEMGLVLARSSMSPVIYEVLDFACGICNPDGQLVAQTNGITVFTGIFSTQIGAVLRKFSGNINPGDIF